MSEQSYLLLSLAVFLSYIHKGWAFWRFDHEGEISLCAACCSLDVGQFSSQVPKSKEKNFTPQSFQSLSRYTGQCFPSDEGVTHTQVCCTGGFNVSAGSRGTLST